MFFETLKNVSKKYKIVVIGERAVEYNEEYTQHGSDQVYSIYNDIVTNIAKDRLVDLTVPSLGITTPNLENIRKDCSVFRDAKFTIMIGFGGAFCLSATTSNVICLNVTCCDFSWSSDWLVNYKHPRMFATKDLNTFISEVNLRCG